MRNLRFMAAGVSAALVLAACGDLTTAPDAASPRGTDARHTVLPTGIAATMAPGGPYNLRTGPSTAYAVATTVPGGSGVTLSCSTQGQSVSGYYGTSVVWNQLSNGYWVTDTNVYTGSNRQVVRPCIRNDYPFSTASTSGVDPWNFYYRQCTSFAAFRVNWNGTSTGQTFTNWYLGQHFGNAESWDDAARAAGVPVYSTPAVGRIAQWNPYVGGTGAYGHVAYVAAVYSSTDILIEEYNWSAYAYTTRRITSTSGYWPSNFIEL